MCLNQSGVEIDKKDSSGGQVRNVVRMHEELDNDRVSISFYLIITKSNTYHR